MGGGCRGMGEEVRGLRSTNRELQKSHGNVMYSIRYGVAKELICMTQGHEKWCRGCQRESAELGGGRQRGIYWDNCKSIINKISLKKFFVHISIS